MQVVQKMKIGPFLVISSVLALWTFLVARPVQAHETTLPTPTCGGLPADAFFGTAETANILSATPAPAIATKQGEGSTTRQKLRYAKITIPALAAGELRVFHTDSGTVSDAVLCQGTSTRATSRTNYSSHNTANTAATAATRAATAAGETSASESAAKSALRRAASALTTAANALTAAGNTDAATAATTAATAATTAAATTSGDGAGDEGTALTAAASALETARDAFHAPFQIRATVEPGDESYVLVVAVPDAATAPTTLALQFHGAIEAGAAAALEGLGGNLSGGEVEDRSILITAPGLLTLETTGRTDTVGTFDSNPEVESGGTGGNFKMVLPVEADATAKTLLVEGQTATTTGDYTLDIDFKVAMTTTAAPTEITVEDGPTWTGDTGIDADDTTLQIDGSADEDYFVFESSAKGFLTIEAKNVSGATRHADTTGTLYGPKGEIVSATGGGGGNHFGFTVPVDAILYLVKVTGTTGQYALQFTFAATTDQGTSASTGDPAATVDCADVSTNDAHEICARGTRLQQERDRYQINIIESGTLYVHTTGKTDTFGTLYGPDGGRIATDDNNGQGNNFRIAARVNPGLHVVEVRGQTSDTQGVYGLVTNFIAGDGGPVTPGTPGTGDDEVTRLRNRITTLQNQLAECRGGVTTDARGSLDDPNSVAPNNGYRSGVGLIRGWVCAANEVEVRIFNDAEVLVATISTPYGSVRADTAGQCDHGRTDTGFAAQYNYNHLPEGEYTARAFADDRQIGAERTFTVVHLTDFASNDTNRFLEDLPAGTCDVEDFPYDGDGTRLRWEESLQNFVIEDAG